VEVVCQEAIKEGRRRGAERKGMEDRERRKGTKMRKRRGRDL
jgi:hypothetical protein